MFLFPKKSEINKLLQLEGDRLYVENVRAMLDSSFYHAQKVCDKYVSNGKFEMWISYCHPICDYEIFCLRCGDDLPDEPVVDVKARASGEEQYQFSINELRQVIFYRMPR